MDAWRGVKETLESMGVDVTDLRPGTELVNALELDSLEMHSLALDLEEKFAIEIPDAEMSAVKTVGDCVGMVRKLRGE